MIDYTPNERSSFYFLRIGSISKLLGFFYGRHFKQIATAKHKRIHDTLQRVHPPAQKPCFLQHLPHQIFSNPPEPELANTK